MSTPTSPVTPSKTSLWVALGVLGGGLLTIALLVAFVIVPGAASIPTYTPPVSAPSEEPVTPSDPNDEPTNEPSSGALPSGNFDFAAGSAVTADMTVAVLANVGDMGSWTFATPPQGFSSSYTNGSCTVDTGTYSVNPEESALGDEEASYLAAERLLKITDRSAMQVTEWGWAPESIQGDSTASMVEGRWSGTDGLAHSGALRSVGTSGIGVLFHTSCADADTLAAAVKELRPFLAITVLSFGF